MASSFGDRFAVVLLGLALVLLAVPVASSAAESPVAAYSFDEGKGEIARDSSGVHDGILDGAEWTEAGKYGGALRFDGEDDIVTIPDSGELDLTEAFTLEAWVRLDQRRAWAPILTKETSGGWFGYQLYAEGGSEVPVGFVSEEDWGPYSGVPGPEPLPLETWKHLALTSDGETMRLYVDGELEASETAMAVQASDGPLQIGGNEVFGEHLDGAIDEVRLYDRVLSGEEIEEDGEAGVGLAPRPKPIAALSFDEGKGEIARDSFGVHDGTLDGAEWIEAGKFGAALRFDGEDDLLTIPDHDELDLTQAFTLEAWVKLDQRRAWAPVFTKETSGGWFGYQLYAEGGSEVPSGFVSEEDWGPYAAVAGAEPLPLEAWRHLAFSSDGQVLRLYVDGELEASETAMAVQASDGPLQIGGNEVFGEHLDGVVDEVRIYDRVLSGEEIEEDGEAGIGIRPPTRFVHDADGRLEAMIEPNGETAVYEWDAAGNLISISRHPSAELSILQLSPSRADVGDSISIEGTGFSPTPGSNTVKFNGTAATVTAATATKLTVEVPEGASAGTVTVATPGEGPVTSPESFTLASSQAPQIASISPTLAEAGDEVTVSGSNFWPTAYANALGMNRSRPDAVSSSASTVKFKVPAAALGGRVSIATPDGSDAGPDLFVVPNGHSKSEVASTDRFSLGESTTVALTPSEKVGLRLIEGSAGQQISLTALSGNLVGTVTIRTPKGEYLGEANFLANEVAAIAGPVTLPETGTYTAVVTPSGVQTGSVKVTAYDVVDLTGPLTPTAEGDEKSVVLTTPGQRARYTAAVEAGESVSVKATGSTLSNYWLRWLDSEGEVVESAWASGSDAFFRTTFKSTGSYTLVVDPVGHLTGSTALVAYDATDITGSTLTPSAEGDFDTFPIEVPGQRNLITFAGTKDQQVSLTAISGNLAGTVTIRSPKDEYLGEANFFANEVTSIAGPVTLPETGTYTAVVTPSGVQTGSVKVTAYDVVDLTGSLTPTAEGDEQPVSITTPGQRARYTTTVEAGEAISVKATGSGLENYWLRWLDSESEVVGSALASGSNTFFRTTFESAGTYTLVVDPIAHITGSTALVVYDSTSITGSTLTPTTEGDSDTFPVEVPGQENLITFAGTEGQQISLTASEPTFGGFLHVRAPGGSTVSESSGGWLSESAPKNIGPFTLPATGTYTIVLRADGTDTGSVELTAYLESSISLISPIDIEARLVSLRTSSAQISEVSSDIPPSMRKPEADRSITAEMRAFQPGRDGTWRPSRASRDGELWIAGESPSPWADAVPLQGPDGQTALSGQALKLNGRPVPGLRVSIEGTSVAARTDGAGRFLLGGAPAGPQVLVVEGESVGGKDRFGTYEVRVELAPRITTQLDYTIWLNPLDEAGDLSIDSPTDREARLRTPSIPGLEVRIPAGTVIRDELGRPIRDLNMTAIPVDRPPFPLPPFVAVPVYFTVQPGGAYLSKGAQFVYPNWGDLAPGQRVDFWNYDPSDRGWYVYGRGTVTDDGEQVVPDPGVRIWEFSGAMATSGATPPGTYPHGTYDGDPVDLFSGLFTYQKTDLVLPDTIPIAIQRFYRPNDTNPYSFGFGSTILYDLRLWAPNNSEAFLILPDGGRVRYIRTTPGESPFGTEYEAKGSPGAYYGSRIDWNETTTGWDMSLTNGMTLTFDQFGAARLRSIGDRYGNTLKIKRAPGLSGDIAEVIAPHGRWAKFTYDESNRITQIADNGGRVFKYTYASGRLVKVEAPAGRTTQYEYDGSGRMKAVVNARGNKYLQNVYDVNGRVEKQTLGDGGTFEFSYDLDEEGQAEATTVTDPLGQEREVEFDASGLPLSETRALGTESESSTSFERQAETELLLSTTDPLERKTDFEYDSFGNVTEITRLAGTEDAVTSKLDYEPGTTNVIEATDPLGHGTEFEYGPKGELLKHIDALENETVFEYDDEGRPISIANPEEEETVLTYEHGDLVAVTDPLGRTTRQFFDVLGRVRAVTSPGGRRAYLEYNDADELTSVVSPSGAETSIDYDKDGDVVSIVDPRENETTATYDAMDRIESETDPLEETAGWDYDKFGNLIEAVDRNGEISKFVYDELGRLASARFGVEGEAEESTIEYEYDAGNRLIGALDSASGEYVLDYDELDRLIAVEGPNGSVGYEYDAAGRRELMAVPGMGTVGYEYDDADRLSEVSDGSQAVSLAYDDADRLAGLTLPDGIEQLYGYDDAGQPTSISYMDGESLLGEIEYAYDAEGRTKSIAGSYGRMSLPQAIAPAEYNAANQLTERGADEYDYDDNGNLIDDGSNEYEWDARGQLTAIAGAGSASFSYDPFGRRISKTLGETTTGLLYDGANAVLESSGEEVTATMLTGLQIDQLFSRTSGEDTESYLTNSLGSTIALADEAGEVDTTYSYDPFGTTTSSGAASDNPYQFTGRENDGTGLQFNRARYYSPADARFLSPDPAGHEASGPNLYNYVNSAPLNFTDPMGLNPLEALPSPVGFVEDAAKDVVSDVASAAVSAGRFGWEHKAEIASAGAAGTCIFLSAGACGVVSIVALGTGTVQNLEKNQCGSFFRDELITVGSTMVGGLPGLLPRAVGTMSPGLLPSSRAGRWALNTPPAATGLGVNSYVEPGLRMRYSGGSQATSSC